MAETRPAGAAVTNPWCTPIEKHLPTPLHSSTIDKLDCDEFPVTESNSAPDENQAAAVTPVSILSMTLLYAAVMSGRLCPPEVDLILPNNYHFLPTYK